VSGTDPDPQRRDGFDRTQAYRPDGATPPPPPPDNLPRIPGITLHFEIARGGMGVVYAGRQDFLDRRVAVKLLSVELGGESFVQRFQREAKILAGIKHPNIVACHMAGQTDDGQSYLVMEFIDGPSLKKWIADHGSVPIKAALRTTRAIAQALGHAHTLGVIHRDVKPENILLETVTSTALDVTFPYTPKVVDLGLARASSGSASLGLTSPGSVMGTPATMSPEQYDEPDAVDFRTDIYGLGCVLYEMLVGQPAFRARKLSEIIAKKRELIAPDPCRENPEVPAAVGALVMSMLATQREHRPSSYRDLDEQLGALLDTMSTPTRVTKAPRPVVGDETEVTRFRSPTQRPDDPTVAKDGGGKDGGGAGLLRTAEIDFLAEGVKTPGGDDASPFRTRVSGAGGGSLAEGQRAQGQDGDAVFRSRPPGGGGGGGGTNVSTGGTGQTAVGGGQGEPKKGKGGLVAAAAIGALALGGVAWLVLKPGGGGGGGGGGGPEPDSNNRPPTVAITGPREVNVGDSRTLEAVASDPDNDTLTYAWTVPEDLVRARRGTSSRELVVDFVEGLPGLQCELQVEVRDQHGRPTIAKHEVTFGEQMEVEQPLLGFDARPEWTIDDSSDTRWVPVTDRNDPHASCRALDRLRTLTTNLGRERYWDWFGSLESQQEDGTQFAKVGLRFEFGERGWAVMCTRLGKAGEVWVCEVHTAVRTPAGGWNLASLNPPVRIDWQQPEDAEDDGRATFSVQRQAGKLVVRVGSSSLGPNGRPQATAGGPEATASFDLPSDSTDGRLTLFVDQGIGRFRIKKR
jgi:tRNA A-37 threonylcarbamoyl transferase component Bud32